MAWNCCLLRSLYTATPYLQGRVTYVGNCLSFLRIYPSVLRFLILYSVFFTPYPSGEMTDLNVWSRRLEEQELADISGCRTRGHGDLLDWDTADFELGQDASSVSLRALYTQGQSNVM